MRYPVALFLGACWLSTPVQAQKLSTEDAKAGFIALFNGKDFSGWRFSDGAARADNWKVEDGVIKLSGGGKPHLASQWDFDDFDIRFEWRAMRAGYNSGFYIRSGRNVGTNQINLAKGGEGGFIGGKIEGAKTVPELQNKPMEWNEWRVVGDGGTITFWCNGKLGWEGKNLAQKRGYFGFQAEGAPIEFRNVRINEKGYELLTSELRGKEMSDENDEFSIKPAMSVSLKKNGNYTFRTEWKCDKGTTATFSTRVSNKPIVFGDAPNGSGAPEDGKVTKKTDYALGEWNFLEIKSIDDKFTVWLNGAVVFTGEQPREPAAPVLGVNGGPMQFRAPRMRLEK